MTAAHLWITGASRADVRAHLRGREAAPPDTVRTSTHRNIRGPYTGAETVLRAVLPEAFERWPELVEAYRVELLYAVPELADLIGAAPDTLADTAPYYERTRYYGAGMIRCMSQGVVGFLVALARRRAERGAAPMQVVFEDVHAAEDTMQELIALLVRRSDPALLRVVVGARPDPLRPELAGVLAEHARPEVAPAATHRAPHRSDDELVAAYVDADGTGDDPAEIRAYDLADPALRSALHDARADRLAADADRGRLIGAIPWHRERGTDPGERGRAALVAAQRASALAGFSAWVVDLGLRGRAVTDPVRHQKSFVALTMDAAAAMVPLDRLAESLDLYLELRGRYPSPRVHMDTSYAIAMLHTRFFRPRDHEAALQWQNDAIAMARSLPAAKDRLVFGVFQDNALALIEMHRGNLARSLELIDAGIARLDAALDAGEWVLHRSQLLYNRARLLTGLGRLDEAYADFTTLIALDPYYTDYLSERAKISRKRGDLDAALADYDRAAAMAPPFPELYYNRGTARLHADDVEGALSDFGHVLDMEPDDVDTRISRAETLLALGDLDAARADAHAGLHRRPDDPRLRCLLGTLDVEAQDWSAALVHLDEALRVDPQYPAALVNRAVVRYQLDQPLPAVDDLTAVLELLDAPDPDVLLNRGIAYAAAGLREPALADFDAALALPDADTDTLRHHRLQCLDGSPAVAGRSAP